jgi:hypothetical protein
MFRRFRSSQSQSGHQPSIILEPETRIRLSRPSDSTQRSEVCPDLQRRHSRGAHVYSHLPGPQKPHSYICSHPKKLRRSLTYCQQQTSWQHETYGRTLISMRVLLKGPSVLLLASGFSSRTRRYVYSHLSSPQGSHLPSGYRPLLLPTLLPIGRKALHHSQFRLNSFSTFIRELSSTSPNRFPWPSFRSLHPMSES